MSVTTAQMLSYLQNDSIPERCISDERLEGGRAPEIKASNPAAPASAPLILHWQTNVRAKDLRFPQSTSEKPSHLSSSHHSIIKDAHSNDNMGLYHDKGEKRQKSAAFK